MSNIKKQNKLGRREMLRRILAASGGAMASSAMLSGCQQLAAGSEIAARAQAATMPQRFLIVVGATGGASIIDSFLAIRESESANAPTVNTFPDALVVDTAGAPFRAVDQDLTTIGPIAVPGDPIAIRQSQFVSKHYQDMLVATVTGSSVNHGVAQQRAVSGGGSWNGRTLQELFALQYGGALSLPNVTMSSVGYSQPGADRSMPASVYGVPILNPALWPLGLDGSRGIAGAPSRGSIELARNTRELIESESNFLHTFNKSPALARWLTQRSTGGSFESDDLITNLNFLPDSPQFPLGQYGLDSAAESQMIRDKFPHYEFDPVEAQAALGYLLLKSGVSCTVTLAPTFDLAIDGDFDLGQLQGVNIEDVLYNPPLAFDLSHTDHRSSQGFMWNRTLGVIDKMIDLLKAQPMDDGSGDSMWDRTLIYVATDFGRDKNRPAGATAWGSGHELNNGVLMISPMLSGNRILGGVDPDTGYTYGFDPVSGAADVGRQMEEKEIFSGLLHALDIDTTGSGLPTVTAFK